MRIRRPVRQPVNAGGARSREAREAREETAARPSDIAQTRVEH